MLAVTEKSSIANPWSLPASSGSCHRSQISCPLLIVTVSVAEMKVRFAAAFPSSVAAVAPVTGLVSLNGENVVQPVAGVLAPVTMPASATCYWKVSVWADVFPPLRHCSPT